MYVSRPKQTTARAIDQVIYHAPSTTHWPPISSVLSVNAHSISGLSISGGVPLASTIYENAHPRAMPREHSKNESISGAPPSRRYSHAEFDTGSNRSFSPFFGFDTQTSRDSPVSSLVSPTKRAQRIEDTQNALTNGIRASTKLGRIAQHTTTGALHRPNATQQCYGPNVATPDALGDTYAQGAPGTTHARAVRGRNFQAQPQQQVRGNGLATETATRHIQRASYTSFVSASARKVRRQSARAKSASKPIRSNWYHKEEMMSDRDIKDQDFVSSDEEDFDKEGRRYSGDMIAQQKLIQKQQRTIFDLNMRYKMLANAMNSTTKEPYEALVDDFGRTCASNRRANRELELMREEVRGLKERCAYLEEAAANLPSSAPPHGMSGQELEDARHALEVETSVTRQKQSMPDELNPRNGDLQKQRLLQLEMKHDLSSRIVADGKSSKDESAQLIDENKALKDKCDSLRRQLNDAHNEIQAHTESTLSVVSSLDLDSDEDMGGNAAHRAEIAMLKVECKYSKQHSKMLEEHVGGLTKELERSHEQLRRLCHDMVRPYLHEVTVTATLAESVSDKIRQCSELKVTVPPANNDNRTTPVKSSEARNNYQSRYGRFGPINSNAAFSATTVFQTIKC
ncbi:hypothetical protein IW140_004878 [Coemansia sp. RSA 1813]|nr:hypothetical protein EV178_002243 [Coemansia sp. RSA 1646]KAJ1770185.1 hypothetical protein LPJ74_003408 [Coemansia sp. RSA 1843]KAJ2090003.1 hypothetical protein IW138_002972 [Coemansia sp. RSA 986]KAJ2566552.1 hypothetical protein IW140_004878 [Coemansia sp. RSA 1813]